jgi:hypothetical protein
LNDDTRRTEGDAPDCKEGDPIVKNQETADDEPLVEMGDVDSYVDEDQAEVSVTSESDREPEPPPRKTFFGEIISKRHPLLIALMMLFAFGLAAGPLFFRYQKNAMSDALKIYKTACAGMQSGRITDDWMKSVSGPTLLRLKSADREVFFRGIQCVDMKQYKSALRPLEGRQFGPDRAYVLSIHQGKDVQDAEKKGLPVINLFFPMVDDTLKIDLMPVAP